MDDDIYDFWVDESTNQKKLAENEMSSNINKITQV